MKLYVRLEPPFEWVRVNAKQVEAFGEVPTLTDYPVADEDEIIGVVPGEWVTAHKVNLPTKSKRQFQAAVPFALEESISEEVEDMHFVCPAWKSGEENTVYVVAKKKMSEWQEAANQNQLPIDRLVPDHALLPFHDAADCSVAVATGSYGGEPEQQQLLASTAAGDGVCLDSDFLEIWLADVPMSATIAVNEESLAETLIENHPDRDFRHWPFGSKMAHWLEHTAGLNYDLFTDQFRPSVRKISWRSFALPALLVGGAFVLMGGYDVYRYFALHAEIKRIDAEQQQIVKSTFPEIDFIEPGKERFMMEQAMARMNGGPQKVTAQSMLAETAAVLRAQRVTLANVVYRESELIITCQLNDFSQVDALTTQLNARPRISARLQSSAADDGEIIASYTISKS
ncbi:MAG: type II secretion system protein GspL [Pseudomonadota bacterium]